MPTELDYSVSVRLPSLIGFRVETFIKGALDNFSLIPHFFFSKNWDFYTIRTVYQSSDCMLHLTCNFNLVTKIFEVFLILKLWVLVRALDSWFKGCEFRALDSWKVLSSGYSIVFIILKLWVLVIALCSKFLSCEFWSKHWTHNLKESEIWLEHWTHDPKVLNS